MGRPEEAPPAVASVGITAAKDWEEVWDKRVESLATTNPVDQAATAVDMVAALVDMALAATVVEVVASRLFRSAPFDPSSQPTTHANRGATGP